MPMTTPIPADSESIVLCCLRVEDLGTLHVGVHVGVSSAAEKGPAGARRRWWDIGRRERGIGSEIDGETVFVWVYWVATFVCVLLAPPEAEVPILALAISIFLFVPWILVFTLLVLINLAIERLF